MAIQSASVASAGTGLWAGLAYAVARGISRIVIVRKRAAWRRELAELEPRQLRDAGIDAIHAKRSEEAAARAVRLANLTSLR